MVKKSSGKTKPVDPKQSPSMPTKAKISSSKAKENDTQSDDPSTYVLAESVDITCINKLYDELTVVLRNAKSVVVDAAQLKRIDTAGLQLLCCWFLEAKKNGIAVHWDNTSGIFANSAELLGMTTILELNAA